METPTISEKSAPDHPDHLVDGPGPIQDVGESLVDDDGYLFVIKRDGSKQLLEIGKIQKRFDGIRDMEGMPQLKVDTGMLSTTVGEGCCSGMDTSQLDIFAAETAVYRSTVSADYGKFAARIEMSKLHKETPELFSEVTRILFENVNPNNGRKAPLLSQKYAEYVAENHAEIQEALEYSRDYGYTWFGIKTLQKGYFKRAFWGTPIDIDPATGRQVPRIVERPQHMLMRVAIFHHMPDMAKILQCYERVSMLEYTHASPTLFNAGKIDSQISSCYLLAMVDDSIDGMYETLKRVAIISKYGGGVGVTSHKIRSNDSYINGTGGLSSGLIPMLQTYNATARHVDQAGNRKGAVANFLEIWHSDMEAWLDLRLNTGKEEFRARDLFYCAWIPDLFMKRLEVNGDWSLMSQDDAPGLWGCWGEEFETLYQRYESEGRVRKVMKARELWGHMLDSIMMTGTPYVMFKDACNAKSNHRHRGVVSSNLCCEIVQRVSPDETAVCNLATVCLPKFVVQHEDGSAKFGFKRMGKLVMEMVETMDNGISRGFTPLESSRSSQALNRSLGIGVQGLADVFQMFGLAWEDEGAKTLNQTIFEYIYFHALKASNRLAKERGTYPTYAGSPVSEGILQMDMWKHKFKLCGLLDWDGLRKDIAAHGLRNSLLTANPPTASTAQICGNTEGFEPLTTNIYTRRTSAGDFVVINEFLQRYLSERGLWNKELKNALIYSRGSVQGWTFLPEDVRRRFKTVYEIPHKRILELYIDRAPFVDQAQSMNIHMASGTFGRSEKHNATTSGDRSSLDASAQSFLKKRLQSAIFYAWQCGAKNGMYYFRTKPAADPIQFTVDQAMVDVFMDRLKRYRNADPIQCAVDQDMVSVFTERLNQHTTPGAPEKDPGEECDAPVLPGDAEPDDPTEQVIELLSGGSAGETECVSCQG